MVWLDMGFEIFGELTWWGEMSYFGNGEGAFLVLVFVFIVGRP